VVRYEYTPGFEKLDQVAIGGQAITAQRLCAARPDADSNEGDSPATLLPQTDPAEERQFLVKCRQAAARVSSLPRCNLMTRIRV